MTSVSRTRKRYSHAELHQVIEAHHRFRTGRSGGIRALLAFADLSGLAIAGCNLAEADLSGASLRGANLSDCNLDRAILFGADLRDSDLEGASLIGANLRGATLRGANLTRANLFKADLRDGSIKSTDLGGNLHTLAMKTGPSELSSARLMNANLTDADMSGAIATHTDFTDCILREIGRAHV